MGMYSFVLCGGGPLVPSPAFVSTAQRMWLCFTRFPNESGKRQSMPARTRVVFASALPSFLLSRAGDLGDLTGPGPCAVAESARSQPYRPVIRLLSRLRL